MPLGNWRYDDLYAGAWSADRMLDFAKQGAQLIVYEPNPYMHERLREAAYKHGLNCELRAVSAEQLDLQVEAELLETHVDDRRTR